MESPCRRQCRLYEDDYCLGCGRTKAHIQYWSRMAKSTQRAIMNQLAGLPRCDGCGAVLPYLRPYHGDCPGCGKAEPSRRRREQQLRDWSG